MPIIPSSSFLQRVLAADATLCLVAGLVLAGGAGFWAGILGLPVDLLRGAGLALLPVAGFVAWLARRRPSPPRRVVGGSWRSTSLGSWPAFCCCGVAGSLRRPWEPVLSSLRRR
jgi:hypothetical protein